MVAINEFLNQNWYLYALFAFIFVCAIIAVVLLYVMPKNEKNSVKSQRALYEKDYDDNTSIVESLTSMEPIYDKISQINTPKNSGDHSDLRSVREALDEMEKGYGSLPSKTDLGYDKVPSEVQGYGMIPTENLKESEYAKIQLPSKEESNYSKSPLPFKQE